MDNSKRIVLLSTILLVAASGCSGGKRLRQVFAPDREFMALSEIEEPGDTAVAESGVRQRLTDMFASKSKEEASDTIQEEEDKIVQTGFLRRLLNSPEGKGLPEDPFLNSDDSKPELPVITAGKSRQESKDGLSTQPNTATKPFDDIDRRSGIKTVSTESSDRGRTFTRSGDAESNDEDPSLSELIADFRNDEDLFPSADRTNSSRHEGGQGDSRLDTGDSFDKFLDDASRNNDPSEKTRSHSDDDDFELDIAMLDELTSTDSVESDKESEFALPDELDDDDSDSIAAEALIRKPDNTDSGSFDTLIGSSVAEKSPASEESDSPNNGLWGSSNDGFSWENPQIVADESAFDDNSLWNSFPGIPVSTVSHSGGDFASSIQTAGIRTTDHATGDVPVRQVSQNETATAANGPFESDPFLADFESQAASTSTPIAAPAATAAVPSGGQLGKIAPRTWLLLLAGVVVLYLLIAPERRNPNHPTNR